MRSRASQARALFRVVNSQSSASSTRVATATSAGSTPSSSTVDAAKHCDDGNTRSKAGTGRPTPFAGLNSSKRAKSSFTSARRRSAAAAASAATASNNASPRHPDLIHLDLSSALPSSKLSLEEREGMKPANPPPTTFSSVASEAFFALQRPLLQHQLITNDGSGHPNLSNSLSATKNVQMALEQAKAVLAEAAASRLSSSLRAHVEGGASEDKRGSITALVITGINGKVNGAESLGILGLEDVLEDTQDHAIWRKPLQSISSERFNVLLDRLGDEWQQEDDTMTPQHRPSSRVQLESVKLDEEEAMRFDREQAVTAALERGEDPSAAKSLGSEADLIVLGEPKGPNPNWPRGVATYLAEKTRAFEPPPVPEQEDVRRSETGFEEGEEGMIMLGGFVLEEGGRGSREISTTSFSGHAQFVDEDPNLFLSHALVQATLPKSLQWDQVVEKMKAASLSEGEGDKNSTVDVGKLNAELPPEKRRGGEVDTDDGDIKAVPGPREEWERGQVVEMDSVKRKRRKKMRKHKYRKFRKATRVERTRLKK